MASARGTLLHFHAECHLNGLEIEKPHSPEFKNFLLLAEALREMGWMPFRTEVCLAHMGLCVCGQLDALFRNDDEELAILDWKNCKNVKFDGTVGESDHTSPERSRASLSTAFTLRSAT